VTPAEFGGPPVPGAAWLLACAIEARLDGQRLPPLTPETIGITPLWVEGCLIQAATSDPAATGPVTIVLTCNRAPGSAAHQRRVRLLAAITVLEEDTP
jgi:hypothetical protein